LTTLIQLPKRYTPHDDSGGKIIMTSRQRRRWKSNILRYYVTFAWKLELEI